MIRNGSFRGSEIGRKIAEAEMDLTKAKSEGYLWGNGTGGTAGSDKKKLLAVIGVYTGFGSRLRRNTFRGSWMPRGMLFLSFSLAVLTDKISPPTVTLIG